MRKNSFFLIILIFVLMGCSKSQDPKTLISKWEKNYSPSKSLERALASSDSGQCLKDVFGVDLLKKQVAEFEGKYKGGKKVTGTWKHLNLSDLPIPQANFLVKYGDKIGNLIASIDIDYRSCADVPCIFNKIYNKENHIAGYVHYIWYLRFGHMLSADNMVPNQISPIAGIYNGKPYQLSDYLYSDQELYAFWRLSMMAEPVHTSLKYVFEVQKIPGKEKFENPEWAQACGIASGEGWIILTDKCLWLYPDLDKGALYDSVLHELSHQVDFQQGRGLMNGYRSRRDDYLKVSGLFINEYVNEKKIMIRQWASAPGTKFISDYSQISPEENFAETMAFYRTDGDRTVKAIAPSHYQFFSQNYYQNKSFGKAQLINNFLNSYSNETLKKIFQSVVDCSKLDTAPSSSYFSAGDFSNPVFPSMLNCLGTRGQEIALSLKAKIAINEPEGCSSLNTGPGQSQWNAIVWEHLRNSFETYLQELDKDKNYLARIESVYKEIADKTIARSAYLNCYGEVTSENCFDREIKRLSFEKAKSVGALDAQAEEISTMYSNYHPYASIKSETDEMYTTMVASHLQMIRDESRKIWDRCESLSHNDEEPPRSGIFNISSNGYLVSSFYNCLNAELPSALNNVLRSFSIDGQKLEHPKEEVILNLEIKNEFKKTLTEFYGLNQMEEMKRSKDFISHDNGSYRKKILSDFSWVQDMSDNAKILSDCKKTAYSLIDFQNVYNLKKDLFGEFAEKTICIGISDTREFNKWTEDSKGTLVENVLNGLETKVLTKANLRASMCLGQFPMNTAVNKIRYKKKREECLLNEWPGIETTILNDSLNDPVVKKFNITTETMRGRLEMNRRRLQIKIMKERFN